MAYRTPREVFMFGVPLRGLGGSQDPAASDKAMLTQLALSLFAQSRANPTDPGLPPQIQNALDQLAAFQPWTDTTDTWSGFISASTLDTGAGYRWSDSQTVRSNLQQALENVLIATGQTSTTWKPQVQPMRSVSVLDSTVQNIPGEVPGLLDQFTAWWNANKVWFGVGAVVVGGTAAAYYTGLGRNALAGRSR